MESATSTTRSSASKLLGTLARMAPLEQPVISVLSLDEKLMNPSFVLFVTNIGTG